jgi:hypothetical protein
MRNFRSLFWVINYTSLCWLLTASIGFIEDIRVNIGCYERYTTQRAARVTAAPAWGTLYSMSPSNDFYAVLSSLLQQTSQNPDAPPVIPLKHWPAGSPEQFLLEDLQAMLAALQTGNQNHPSQTEEREQRYRSIFEIASDGRIKKPALNLACKITGSDREPANNCFLAYFMLRRVGTHRTHGDNDTGFGKYQVLELYLHTSCYQTDQQVAFPCFMLWCSCCADYIARHGNLGRYGRFLLLTLDNADSESPPVRGGQFHSRLLISWSQVRVLHGPPRGGGEGVGYRHRWGF